MTRLRMIWQWSEKNLNGDNAQVDNKIHPNYSERSRVATMHIFSNEMSVEV